MATLELGERRLSIEDVVRVARESPFPSTDLTATLVYAS